MHVLKEIIQLLWIKKKFWLIPIVVLMLVAGLLMVAAEGSAFAPFIYAIF